MLHTWCSATDGNRSTIRTILYDYWKASFLIDHRILVGKLHNLNHPNSVTNWITDFLRNLQRIILINNCYTEWDMVPSAGSQGTQLRIWLFHLMINDLDIEGHGIWKCVDEQQHRKLFLKMRQETLRILRTLLCLDPPKIHCKELRVSLDGKELKVVDTVDFVGVTIVNQLTWNSHIEKVIKETGRRLLSKFN